MKHTLSHHTTSRGLPVLLIDIPESPVVDISISTRSGFRFAVQQGVQYYEVPHLLEHMVFEGSKHYPDYDELQDIFTQKGGLWNGLTDNYNTAYTFHTRPDVAHKVLRAALDVVYHPTLAQTAYDEELRVVEREASDRMADFAWAATSYALLAAMPDFPQCPDMRLGWVSSTMLDDVRAYHKKYYTLRNSDVIVAADFSRLAKEDVLADIEAATSDVPRGKRLPYPAFTVQPGGEPTYGVRIGRRMQDTIGSFLLLRPGKLTRKEEVSLMVFCVMATDMKRHSVLYKLRKKGLLYDIEIVRNSSEESGAIEINLSAEHAKFTAALGYALEALRQLAEEGIPNAVFESVRQHLLGTLEEEESSPEAIMGWYCNDYLVTGEDYSPADQAVILRELTQDEVLETVRRFMKKQHMYGAVFSGRRRRAMWAADAMVDATLVERRSLDDAYIFQQGGAALGLGRGMFAGMHDKKQMPR